MKQITFNCKRSLIILDQTTINTHNTRPSHCPCCSHHRPITDTTIWDEYTLRLNLPNRQITRMMLVKMPRALLDVADSTKSSLVNSTNASPFTAPKYRKLPSHNLSDIDIAEQSMHRLANSTQGTTTLHAHCSNCISHFTFLVSDLNNSNTPTLQTIARPLTYCPYCGTNTLIITPEAFTATERSENAWSLLAQTYNMSPEYIKGYYTFWETSHSTTSFAQFMSSLPNLTSLELKPNTPRNQVNRTTAKKIRIRLASK